MAGLLIVFCFSRYRIKELVHCASAHVIGSAGPMHVPTLFFLSWLHHRRPKGSVVLTLCAQV